MVLFVWVIFSLFLIVFFVTSDQNVELIEHLKKLEDLRKQAEDLKGFAKEHDL